MNEICSISLVITTVKALKVYPLNTSWNTSWALQELGLQDTSIARKRVAIKQFFSYLAENDLPMHVDFDLVPQIKIGQHLPDTLSVSVMNKLLDSLPVHDSLSFRNKVMMELLYATGWYISSC
jgi:integrase/recombinase XerD